jgi:hypothetical protein
MWDACGDPDADIDVSMMKRPWVGVDSEIECLT